MQCEAEDIYLPGHKHEDVAGRLLQVDRDDLPHLCDSPRRKVARCNHAVGAIAYRVSTARVPLPRHSPRWSPSRTAHRPGDPSDYEWLLSATDQRKWLQMRPSVRSFPVVVCLWSLIAFRHVGVPGPLVHTGLKPILSFNALRRNPTNRGGPAPLRGRARPGAVAAHANR